MHDGWAGRGVTVGAFADQPRAASMAWTTTCTATTAPGSAGTTIIDSGVQATKATDLTAVTGFGSPYGRRDAKKKYVAITRQCAIDMWTAPSEVGWLRSIGGSAAAVEVTGS